MRIEILHGDSFEILKTFEGTAIDAVISDPPYGINFMSNKWDNLSEGQEMQKWHVGWLQPCYDALRPGGVIKAFAATRTLHRLAAAMEEVGFILEADSLLEAWTFSTGFPKSYNVSKGLDDYLGHADRNTVAVDTTGFGQANVATNFKGETRVFERTESTHPGIKPWEGFGTALKPAWEPFIVGKKAL